MIDEADEFPLTEMDDTLRHVKGHMDDRDFFVLGGCRLVRQEWVVNHPRLRHRLLGIVEVFGADITLLDPRADHI